MAIVSASSAHLLRLVAGVVPGGSVNIFDREYRYLFVAGAGLSEVGLTADRLIGRTLRDVFGADAASVEPHYDRAFAGEDVLFDLPVFERIYAVTAAPFLDADAIVVLAQDVTLVRGELRRHEMVEAALDAANRQKDAFVATVLHELRQPLAPLRFGLEVLKRQSPVSSRGGRSMAAMERQVLQLERLVFDLTELARTGQRDLTLQLARVDVIEVLRGVLQETEGLMRGRRHELVSRLSTSTYVMADAGRLRQVFSNLLLNAATYTDPGGHISVSTGIEVGELAIRVADNGRGIDPLTLPHIFELFVQEETAGVGMGIGLHVVQQIVARHGGRVEASSPGKGLGSEFVIRLPLLEEGPHFHRPDRVSVVEPGISPVET